MAPPVWAYQVDYFDPPPDEELICSVCRAVFCDPVQSPCHHVFCRSCIIKWLESNRNCPICRKRTTKYTVQEVVPIVRNMIMKLTLYCHNKDKGCEEKFSLESCEGHLKVCAYETTRCSNKPCKEMLMRKDLADHETNNCLHRYTRCKTCCLKISSLVPTKHNCIKALKKRLREKNELIKIKNLKIVELQNDIKALKESRAESSDISSLDSLSANDILINLPMNDSFDSTSFASESEEENNSSPILNFLNAHFPPPDNSYMPDYLIGEGGIEYPRISSPSRPRGEASHFLDTMFGQEQQLIRRAAKRRLPFRAIDSSDDDNVRNEEPPPAPSPKRTTMNAWPPETMPLWMVQERKQLSSQTEPVTQTSAPESNIENPMPSSSTASGSGYEPPVCNSNSPFQLRPRNRTSNTEQVTSSRTRGIFERTRALLERYSLESDTEWLPTNNMDAENVPSDSDSSFQLPVYPDDHFSSSSSSNSSNEDSSSDSSYVDAQSRTNMLCGLYSTSSSDDPDWVPP